MEKRMIGAIALCFLAYILFLYLFPPAKTDQAATPAQPAATAAATPAASLDAEGAATSPATPVAQPAAAGTPVSAAAAPVAGEAAAATPAAPPTTPAAPPAVPDVVGAPGTVVEDNPLFRLEFDTQGAVLKHFVLKKYLDHGKPVDLVLDPTPFTKTKPAPDERFFSLSIPVNALEKNAAAQFNADAYQVTDVTGARPHPVRGTPETCRTVTFRLVRGGVSAVKEYSIWKSDYTLRMFTSLKKGETPLAHFVRLGPGLTNSDLTPGDPSLVAPHAVYSLDGKATPVTGETIAKLRRQAGNIAWAGVQNKYFLAAAIPANPYSEIFLENRDIQYKPKPTEEAKVFRLVSTFVPGGESFLFLGPKAYDVLSAVRGDLTQTIDYGMFSFIVRPLHYVMVWVHRGVPNMGWSLVILTLIITLALFPLRFHQMKSMKKMQVIQPQMKAIQARYRGKKSAEDRQRMNAETMALYKEAGVNPMGGCLPLLAQLPFLFAFYSLVSQSIEFWRQPFVLWIRDLSMADPTWITPILMGASMIVQMKQTPTAPGQDNKSQKMMMWVMPVIMTFMFISLASGLVIYFLFSNIFAWGMQAVSERLIKTPKVELASIGRKGK